MSEAIRASVAMAVYNGEQYIRQQIDSILERMGLQDELVISYDRSTDATRQIIDGYAASDSRVRVIENHNPGVQNNFNNAVMACRGKYIFLSDQDDLWIGDKINVMVEALEKTGATVAVHDGYMTHDMDQIPEETIFDTYGRYDSPIRNIIKCNFWGCCMAFRADFREVVCPFPNKGGVGHDLWLGVMAGFHGKIVRVEQCFIKHRLHENNVTVKRRALPAIARHRAYLMGYLIEKNAALIGRKRK